MKLRKIQWWRESYQRRLVCKTSVVAARTTRPIKKERETGRQTECFQSPMCVFFGLSVYTLSEAWSGVNWADLMAAQGAFGTDFYDKSILRPKHRAYHRSGRPVIKIGPKGALGSHEIRPIHSARSLGQSICLSCWLCDLKTVGNLNVTSLSTRVSQHWRITYSFRCMGHPVCN